MGRGSAKILLEVPVPCGFIFWLHWIGLPETQRVVHVTMQGCSQVCKEGHCASGYMPYGVGEWRPRWHVSPVRGRGVLVHLLQCLCKCELPCPLCPDVNFWILWVSSYCWSGKPICLSTEADPFFLWCSEISSQMRRHMPVPAALHTQLGVLDGLCTVRLSSTLACILEVRPILMVLWAASALLICLGTLRSHAVGRVSSP